jgi:serine/threonine-protein kinase
VALKFPHEEDIDLAAIRREAALWEEIKGHPNILPIIKADVIEGQVYLASEYASDGSLQEWLTKNGGRAPSVQVAVDLTQGILAGLAHLHAKQVIHRDLKPANILLQSNTPRIADFGISRILRTTGGSASSAGTPSYMAPECFAGNRSAVSDLWAVGVIFTQLLTGQLPFPQADPVSLMNAVVNQEPEIAAGSLPPDLVAFLRRSLAKDPDQRFQSAREMSLALVNVEFANLRPARDVSTAVLPETQRAGAPTRDVPTAVLPETKSAGAPTIPDRTPPYLPPKPPPATRRSSGRSNIFDPDAVPEPGTSRGLIWAGAIALLLVLVLSAVGIVYVIRNARSTDNPNGVAPNTTAASPLLPSGVTIVLPGGVANADPDAAIFRELSVVVLVPNDDEIYANRGRVTLDELGHEIARLYGNPSRSSFQQATPPPPVYVVVGAGVSYDIFEKIRVILRERGVSQLGLVVERPDRSLGRYLIQLPAEPAGEPDISTMKPDPLTLIVRINADRSVRLNAESAGMVDDLTGLSSRLTAIFNERGNLKPFQAAAEPVYLRRVFVKADPWVKYGDLVKVIGAVKGGGADPIAIGYLFQGPSEPFDRTKL